VAKRWDHTRQIAADVSLLKLLGLAKIPDPGTTGEWLKRTYAQGYEGLRLVILELNHRLLATAKREVYTLDPDATAIESHKSTAKMTYKGFRSYMPMLGMLAEVPVWRVLPTAWRTKTIKTLRWIWIHTAGKLVRHGRRWILKLAGLSVEAWRYWRDIRSRCLQLS